MRALSERWAQTGFGPDVLVSSPVRRARETAEILAASMPGLGVVEDCALCEMHNGEADGLTWQQSAAKSHRPMPDPSFAGHRRGDPLGFAFGLGMGSACRTPTTDASRIGPSWATQSSRMERDPHGDSQCIKPYRCLQNFSQGVERVSPPAGCRLPGEAAARGQSLDERVPWLGLFEQSVQMRPDHWQVSRDAAFGSSL